MNDLSFVNTNEPVTRLALSFRVTGSSCITLYNIHMKNFWKELPKPFTVLAPMEDVTDIVFRKIIDEIAAPDVYFTEFVNCEGLVSEGKKALIHRLMKTTKESLNTKKPVVAQIWGLDPINFKAVAKMAEEMGFDGVDINMGCPQRNVTKTGACSALIKNPDLAQKIIQATKEGAKNIPVSVKTRIGFNKIATEEWLEFLLQQNLSAITVHLRTTKEQSLVPAHWEEMGKIVQLRNKLAQDTVIIGNGDLQNYSDVSNKCKEYSMEGGMIGRGIFKNIQAFDKNNYTELNQEQRINLCKKHVQLFAETWNNIKKYEILKKYYKIYINGFEGAKELRNALMETKSPEEALNILLSSND